MTKRGAASMRSLMAEVIGIFHRLHAMSTDLHGGGDLSAGRLGVLRGLARLGPQTVPVMARARPVSRQYMQVLVDGLASDKLVALVVNPAHARSKLVAITALGRKFLAGAEARESEIYEALARGFDVREVERSTTLVRSIRDALTRYHETHLAPRSGAGESRR
jgi:DNA-binding MarR family transcriptional regulator